MMRTPTATGRLDGKIAMITGGASGLGLAACRLFVNEGARVLVADIRDEAGQGLVSELGDRVSFRRCDVRDEANIQASVAQAVDQFGGLDVTYHSAGAVGDRGT